MFINHFLNTSYNRLFTNKCLAIITHFLYSIKKIDRISSCRTLLLTKDRKNTLKLPRKRRGRFSSV